MRIEFLVTLIVVLAAGCAKDQNGLQKVSSADAVNLSSSQAHFENSQDPPFNARTHFAAGQLAESNGEMPRAIEQYKEAVKLDSKNQPALYRLGILYAQARHYADAIEVWKQYVKATNYSATAYANLAFCYELAERPSDAETAYKVGIKREPGNQACQVNYGLMLAKQGNIEEAVKHLNLVLKPAEVHYNIAAVYDQQGKKDAAKLEYEKALELDPNLSEAHMRLSKLE